MPHWHHINPDPLDLSSGRRLIEALSVLSSDLRLRRAAATWLAAYEAAVGSGLAESAAQAWADATLREASGLVGDAWRPSNPNSPVFGGIHYG